MVRFRKVVSVVGLALTAFAFDGNEVSQFRPRHKALHSQYHA
jgi:hypothetical protein